MRWKSSQIPAALSTENGTNEISNCQNFGAVMMCSRRHLKHSFYIPMFDKDICAEILGMIEVDPKSQSDTPEN
jgi:hypothetical protein